jgi:hypothetical protein
MVAFNILSLYVVFLAGKLKPHPLSPMHGALDWFFLVAVGINSVTAIVAVLRWRELDQW